MARPTHRIYDVNPTAPGELNARTLGVRAFCHPMGDEYFKLPIRRIELEDDADEGFATIFAFAEDNKGQQIGGANDDVIQFSFRAYVRIRRRDGTRLDGGPLSEDPAYQLDEFGRIWKIFTPEQVAAMPELTEAK
jgi:hypothetical protein